MRSNTIREKELIHFSERYSINFTRFGWRALPFCGMKETIEKVDVVNIYKIKLLK